MKKLNSVFLLWFTLVGLTVAQSCSDKDDLIKPTPSEVLASTAWETTGAKNHQRADVTLSDPNVSNFIGFAYFKSDGTFAMYNLDDSPKMHGNWSVSADGKTRTIVAKNDQGETLFTRVVAITTLTEQEFTYRIYPSAEDKSIYFDIIHTPTKHEEPLP